MYAALQYKKDERRLDDVLGHLERMNEGELGRAVRLHDYELRPKDAYSSEIGRSRGEAAEKDGRSRSQSPEKQSQGTIRLTNGTVKQEEADAKRAHSAERAEDRAWRFRRFLMHQNLCEERKLRKVDLLDRFLYPKDIASKSKISEKSKRIISTRRNSTLGSGGYVNPRDRHKDPRYQYNNPEAKAKAMQVINKQRYDKYKKVLQKSTTNAKILEYHEWMNRNQSTTSGSSEEEAVLAGEPGTSPITGDAERDSKMLLSGAYTKAI